MRNVIYGRPQRWTRATWNLYTPMPVDARGRIPARPAACLVGCECSGRLSYKSERRSTGCRAVWAVLLKVGFSRRIGVIASELITRTQWTRIMSWFVNQRKEQHIYVNVFNSLYHRTYLSFIFHLFFLSFSNTFVFGFVSHVRSGIFLPPSFC